MQKYRKRQPRTEIVEPIFGMGFDMGKDVEKAAFVGVGGRLEEWYRDDFDREYERAEEDTVEATVKAGWGEVFDALNSGKETKPKPLRCQRCGMSMSSLDGVPRTAYHLDGRGPLCSHCYHTLKPAKKPTPLTLAGLEPGDVFQFADVSLQHDDQVLTLEPWRRYCSSQEHIPQSSWEPSTPVIFIAHHPITPKQQLWIDATAEERKALEDSLTVKWLPIMREEKVGQREADCPLCELAKHDCLRCIICKATHLENCTGTPWSRAAEAGNYPGARAFALWLAEFLPSIHPTRIEIEATPVEWPGVQK